MNVQYAYCNEAVTNVWSKYSDVFANSVGAALKPNTVPHKSTGVVTNLQCSFVIVFIFVGIGIFVQILQSSTITFNPQVILTNVDQVR